MYSLAVYPDLPLHHACSCLEQLLFPLGLNSSGSCSFSLSDHDVAGLHPGLFYFYFFAGQASCTETVSCHHPASESRRPVDRQTSVMRYHKTQGSILSAKAGCCKHECLFCVEPMDDFLWTSGVRARNMLGVVQ